MRILRSTPILMVDQIEPHLSFWKQRMGYDLTASVPHGDAIGFVILARDGQEVMLQTHASAADDLPEVGRHAAARGVAFFHEVDNLEEVMEKVKGLKVVGGPRTAVYGMREVFVVDTAGVVHGYAQKI